MGLHIVAEALARIEHKLDLILQRLGFLDKTPLPQMQFVGMQCPVCQQQVQYQIDMTHNVVVRRCNCTTGKVPSLIPLSPIGEPQNGNPSSGAGQRTNERFSKDRPPGEEG